MQRKVDLGEDKNLFRLDPNAQQKPQASFLMDDLPKSPEAALTEAREATWSNWINSDPLLIAHLDDDGKSYLFHISENIKNKVVLVDFWDYTLLPCKRALSYVVEWTRRYQPAGLVTVGVHCPMFEFGKDKKNVLDAIRAYDITYPVVLDNNFDIWRSFENRYWPRRILFDPSGKPQKDVVGEGDYVEFEKNIQLLLREISPGLACPPVIRPTRKIDLPDYQIPATTQDIFFGFKRKTRFANAQPFTGIGEEMTFTDESQGSYAPDLPYLNGKWVLAHESIHGTNSKDELQLAINFKATDVYMVAQAKPKNPGDVSQAVKVQIWLDQKLVSDDNLGEDAMINEFRRSVATIRDPKLYHLVTGLEHKEHLLTLKVEMDATDTLEIFALFFEHGA
ncbi:MAG: thioredoxin-like domain-containing protein [Bdellovibrionota bacterium]